LEREIYHIASDFFSGRITDPDKKYLDNWLNASAENKEAFEELARVWKLAGKLEMTKEADIDAEWDTFVKIREQKLIHQKKRIISINTSFIRIAAIILPAILLLSALVFLWLNKQKEAEWITLTTDKEKQYILLPDSSEVWINKGSTFSYPLKFSKQERLVKLAGEAFFKVSKTGSTFKVSTGNTEIKVLGTRFTIRCHPDNTKTEVFVEEGKVLFRAQADLKNEMVLSGGEKGLFVSKEIPILKEKIHTINFVAWVTQKISFSNTPLKQVAVDLENYFGKKVIVPAELENCLFSGDFTDPKESDIIEIISLTLSCKYKITPDFIQFEGDTCKK
jgi:ferric-dicitrate binding protein FerR (iron transport regulator)